MDNRVKKEAARRRAFAINLAGSVTAKKKQRETASDWMELVDQLEKGLNLQAFPVNWPPK